MATALAETVSDLVREAVAGPRRPATLTHVLPDGSKASKFTSRPYTHVATSTGHRLEPTGDLGKRRVVSWHESHASAHRHARELVRRGWGGVLVSPVNPEPGEDEPPQDEEAPVAGTTPPVAGPTPVMAALIEAAAGGWSEALHPRDRGGMWAAEIGRMHEGSKLRVGSVSVAKVRVNKGSMIEMVTHRVVGGGFGPSHHITAEAAAASVRDRLTTAAAAAHTHPARPGGPVINESERSSMDIEAIVESALEFEPVPREVEFGTRIDEAFDEALHPRDRGGKFGISGIKVGHVIQFSHKSPQGFLRGRVTSKGSGHVKVKLSEPGTNQNEMRVTHERITHVLVPGAGSGAPGTPQADKWTAVEKASSGLPKGAPRGSTIASFPTDVSSKDGPVAKMVDAHSHAGPGGDAAVHPVLRQHLEAIPKGGVRTIGGVHVEREIKQGDYNVEGDRHLTGVHNAVTSIQSVRQKRGWGGGKVTEAVERALAEAADSMAKASSPEPFSTSKTSNWVARRGGLPAYVQHIAHDIMEDPKHPKTESEAIRLAIGIVKNPPASWDANAKAAAAKAAAEWEAKKGRAKVSEAELAVFEVDLSDDELALAEAALGEEHEMSYAEIVEAAIEEATSETAYCPKDKEMVKPTSGGKCPVCGGPVKATPTTASTARYPVAEATDPDKDGDDDTGEKVFCIKDRTKVTPTAAGKCPKCGMDLKPAMRAADKAKGKEGSKSSVKEAAEVAVILALQEGSHSAEKRRQLAKEGKALSDGSYPIETKGDLDDAKTLAASGHGNAAGAKRLIAKRAKELGVKNPLGS